MTPFPDGPAAAEPPTPVVVDVHGDLDRKALPHLVEQLDNALSAQPAQVVVDLEDCSFVDATSLAALVDTHRRVRREGGVLTLAHCSPRVLRLLTLTGLRRVFDVRG
jgi:anti-anti-sigma factor